nr:uncharacterized protein LOC129263389 [Lytechinus pictus]
MTGCCALGCTNRSEKGFHMFRFPSNPERRKLWENKVRRVGWKPTSSTFLCEVHFDIHQFELGRQDKKVKLKTTAVPNIFCFSKPPKVRKSPKKRVSTSTRPTCSTGHKAQDHSYSATPPEDISTGSSEDSASKQETVHDTQRNIKLEGRLTKMKVRMKELKADMRRMQKTRIKVIKSKAKQESRFSRLFGSDQIRALSRGGMRGVEWSSSTVKKALQLRFACGASGYKVLLKQHHPLPSERTLRRRMEKVSFQPGVLGQVFDFLKLKVEGMHPDERLCCLTLDEMSLTSSVEYDAGGGDLMGSVTLPQHDGTATHALVFMLGGITTRWKQTVCYHYTSNSTDGAVFKDIVLDIIQRSSDIGLHVEAVASDMGSANRAMWKSFGIKCGKHCRTKSKIPHPQDPAKWLHFLADVPHLFKNIKAALVNGQQFTFSAETVTKFGLKSDVACVEPLKDLGKFQENLDLKLAPKLNMAALTPTHFDKMKVSNATRVLSHDVSCALTYLVKGA